MEISNKLLAAVVGVCCFVFISLFFFPLLFAGSVVGFIFCWFFKGWYVGFEKEGKKRKLERMRVAIKDLEDDLK